MGCHFLLQCVKVKSESEVAQLCPTSSNPMDCSLPGSLSIGFSRQEYWSGVPFPSPMHESESEVAQSCPTLSDPMDCSLPGCSVHGIFQARVLEWGAIAFSETTTRSIQLVAIHFRNYSLLNLSSHLSLACAQVSEYLPCTLESFFSFFKIATALKLRDKRLLFFFNHCF